MLDELILGGLVSDNAVVKHVGNTPMFDCYNKRWMHSNSVIVVGVEP